MRSAITFTLLVALVILTITIPYGSAQFQSNDLAILSYHAFNELATVYRQGGQAPDLTSKLNQALDLMREAQLKRLQGDNVGATGLESQARTILTDVLKDIPSAQQTASNEATARTLMIIAFIPLTVLASTFVFYLSLRGWRRYERSQLLEMRIVRWNVEKETKD